MYMIPTHINVLLCISFWYQPYSTVNPYFFYFYRFLICSPKWTDDMKNQINALITNYVKAPYKCQDTNSIITHICECNVLLRKYGQYL